MSLTPKPSTGKSLAKPKGATKDLKTVCLDAFCECALRDTSLIREL